ncbi:MAG: ABC-type transport auxiliary lipoprotein family protein [Marivita sp.]|uniref:ABC-type transport auxiliary lipoprotein family protein n=1 Tax=Marivita sp. TaxID=2003365 RepID=UPI0025BE2F41|nr:ABC-type transport auxiliary lipoprotein family protein [Marivita sp.]MCI5112537.1 ABC-type transport auxiliary lipoprotein family protein [Marivita sp.]
MIASIHLRKTLAVMAMALLSGCAAISAVSDAATPLDVFELRAPDSIAATSARPRAIDVIVEIPTTSGALATDRIMIRPNALQAQYLPEVRWSEPTPVMVQTLMLRSIEAMGAVRYVGRKPLGVSGDFALVTEVIDFQADVVPGTDTANVQITLLVRVVRERDASIVASRRFTASALSPTTETLAVIDAFSAASDQVFADFAAWVGSTL